MGCKLAGKRRDSSDRMERRGGRFGTVAAKNLAEMAASAALRPAARAQAYPPPLAIGGRLVLAGDPTPDASVVVADGLWAIHVGSRPHGRRIWAGQGWK
jgi:hypothetical protein